MRVGSGTDASNLTWLAADHLNSTSLMIRASDHTITGEVRYYPWGQTRYQYSETPNQLPTDRLYTGQREESALGLYYYNARWYDPALSHFIMADTIIPGTDNPLAWDRYAYTLNNPIKYSDPSGHFAWLPVLTIGGALIGAGISYGTQVYDNYQSNGGDLGAALTQNIDLISVGESAMAGAAIGFSVAVAAPVVVGLAGDALVGAGLATGSTTLFSAGMSAYEVSAGISAAVYGTTQASKLIGQCSFSANTLIETSEGEKVISDIDTGDYVLAYNESIQTNGYYKVSETWVHYDPYIVNLTIKGEVVVTTPEHPFYTQEWGWVEANNLFIGMHVLEADGEYGEVQKIQIYKQIQPMYNLTVDHAHTYYVGEGQWLVHNACRSSGKLQPDSNASGPHSTFKRDPTTGKVTNYATWEQNPNNNNNWQSTIRYDGIGAPHAETGTGVKILPHVHSNPIFGSKVVRHPFPEEMPK